MNINDNNQLGQSDYRRDYERGLEDGYRVGIMADDESFGYYDGFSCGAEQWSEEVAADAELAYGNEPAYGEDYLTDVEADSMTLAGAGYGTDEDYGYYGDDFDA